MGQGRGEDGGVVRSAGLDDRDGSVAAPEDLQPALVADLRVGEDQAGRARAERDRGQLVGQVGHQRLVGVVTRAAPVRQQVGIQDEERLAVGPAAADVRPGAVHGGSVAVGRGAVRSGSSLDELT